MADCSQCAWMKRDGTNLSCNYPLPIWIMELVRDPLLGRGELIAMVREGEHDCQSFVDVEEVEQ